MNPRQGVRATTLALAALVTILVAWLGLQWMVSRGQALPHPGWLGLLVMVALSGGLLIVGWPVKKMRDGTAERHVSPLRAARTLVLAQAGALTGAVLTGWYAAAVLAVLPDADVDSVRSQIWALLAHVLGALLLSAAGMVVQRWCRVLPRDEDDLLSRDDEAAPPA